MVRAFIHLRRLASEVASVTKRLEAIEQDSARRFQDHDGKLQASFQALRDLLNRHQDPAVPSTPAKRPIGFRGHKR